MEEDGIMNLGTIIWGENVKNNGTFCIHTCYFMDNGDNGVKFLWKL
jgi:hypothetical protein